jgi:hypothetical protein
LREHQSELTELRARVIVISFESPERAALFAESESVSFPLLLDPSRRAYAAFGLEQGSFREIWTLKSLVAYIRGLLGGQALHMPRGDITQLGGDFVLDGSGRIVFFHRSSEPADRPHASAIVAAVRAALPSQREEQEHAHD